MEVSSFFYLAERMVLDESLTIHLAVLRLPVFQATLILDRVGKYLTKLDKTLYMQNNVTGDYWQLAREIAKNMVVINYMFVFVMTGV